MTIRSAGLRITRYGGGTPLSKGAIIFHDDRLPA